MVVASVALALSVACQTTTTKLETWVPTDYEIHDISEATRDRLRALLEERDYGYAELGSSDRVFRFQLRAITTIEQVNAVQKLIREVSDEDEVPVNLGYAFLRFASVEGTAEARIVVLGTATPGAVVYLDDGSGSAVIIEVGESGRWEVAISTEALEKRDGWIYMAIIGQGAQLYQRASVFDASKLQNIDISELPMDSSIRGALIRAELGSTEG